MPRWNNEHPINWSPRDQRWICRDFNCGFYITNEELAKEFDRDITELDKERTLWVKTDGNGNFL